MLILTALQLGDTRTQVAESYLKPGNPLIQGQKMDIRNARAPQGACKIGDLKGDPPTRAPACSVNVPLCPNRGREGGGLQPPRFSIDPLTGR